MEHLDSLLDIGNGVVADNANGDLLVDGAAFDCCILKEKNDIFELFSIFIYTNNIRTSALIMYKLFI